MRRRFVPCVDDLELRLPLDGETVQTMDSSGLAPAAPPGPDYTIDNPIIDRLVMDSLVDPLPDMPDGPDAFVSPDATVTPAAPVLVF